MSTKKFTPRNEINIRGTIIGSKASGNFTSFIIISDDSEKKGSTVVNVSFYKNVMGDFKIKDHVDIVAHMQSKIIKGEDGKRSYHQLVVGDKIKHTNRLLYDYFPREEFKTTEGGIPDDINKAFICGKVSRVYAPNDNYAIVTVIVPSKENKANFCDVVCYRRQAKLASLITTDDYVVAVGEIRSAKEKPAANTIFKQNVICKDIACVDKENFDTSVYEDAVEE